MPDGLTLHEAAERLGVHYMTVYRYIRTGRLPATRDGRNWRIAAADVERLHAPARVRRGQGSIKSDGSKHLVARMIAGDETGAWNVVEAALASSLQPSAVYHDLLVPALREIGRRWEDGTLTVADEHAATTVAQRIVGRLGPRFVRRGRKRGTVVVGAAPGDEHGLPSAILADLLREARFEVHDLGANVPAESFAHAAQHADHLVAVLIGATTPGRDNAVRAAVRALRRTSVDARVLVGGAAIRDDAHARELGANGWTGPDAESAVDAVQAILSHRGSA